MRMRDGAYISCILRGCRSQPRGSVAGPGGGGLRPRRWSIARSRLREMSAASWLRQVLTRRVWVNESRLRLRHPEHSMREKLIPEALNAHWQASAAGDLNAEHDI